jgi:hypothetical protein
MAIHDPIVKKGHVHMQFSHKRHLTSKHAKPEYRRVFHKVTGRNSTTESGGAMKQSRDSNKDVELAMTLLIFGALLDKRQQPVQLRDLERSVYSAIEAAIHSGDLQPATFLRYEPSQLFGNLQELRQCEFVVRRPEGYDITEAGRHQAQAWSDSLFQPSTRDRLRAGAEAAA